jgi:hypothetical protein
MVASQCIRPRLSHETQVEERRFSAASCDPESHAGFSPQAGAPLLAALARGGKAQGNVLRVRPWLYSGQALAREVERLNGRGEWMGKVFRKEHLFHTILAVFQSTYNLLVGQTKQDELCGDGQISPPESTPFFGAGACPERSRRIFPPDILVSPPSSRHPQPTRHPPNPQQPQIQIQQIQRSVAPP